MLIFKPSKTNITIMLGTYYKNILSANVLSVSNSHERLGKECPNMGEIWHCFFVWIWNVPLYLVHTLHCDTVTEVYSFDRTVWSMVDQPGEATYIYTLSKCVIGDLPDNKSIS